MKAIKWVFAILFWPVAIFLIAKSIRGRILGGVSSLFYAYAVYHISGKFFSDMGSGQDFIFYYEFMIENAVSLILFLILAAMAFEGEKKTSRETTGLGARGKHIRGRIFKPVSRFGGLKTGTLGFGQHKIDPSILKTHAVVAGTTGSGKTQTLYPLIKYIVENNLKAIITDPKIEFAARFMKKGDIVLSPFFKESARWTPFCEIEDYSDCVSIAHFLIPTESGETETWNAYARDLLSDIFYCLIKENVRSTAAVLAYLKNPTDALPLFERYQRTSAGLFEKGAEKLLQSVRFVSSQIAKSIEILPDEGDFSIRNWAKQNQGILWLPYSVKQREAISRLLPLWISLGITGSMLPERVNSAHQTFFVLDELDSIGKVDKLPVLVTEGRGYGLSAVLGFQNIGQITKRYKEEANSILSVVNSFFILRQGSGAEGGGQISDAKFWSDFIGCEEIERVQRSESKKGLSAQGSNESKHIETVKLATPEQLQSLESRTGFAIFSGDIDTKSADGIVRDFKVGISAFPVINKLTEQKVEPLLPNAPDIEVITSDSEDSEDSEEKEEKEDRTVVFQAPVQVQEEKQEQTDQEEKQPQQEDKYERMAVAHGWLSENKQEQELEKDSEETEEQDDNTEQTTELTIEEPIEELKTQKTAKIGYSGRKRRAK